MRIYEQITEGQIVLRRCQGGCGLWYLEADLCTNEETLKLQCDECYMVWQAEQEDFDDELEEQEDIDRACQEQDDVDWEDHLHDYPEDLSDGGVI